MFMAKDPTDLPTSTEDVLGKANKLQLFEEGMVDDKSMTNGDSTSSVATTGSTFDDMEGDVVIGMIGLYKGQDVKEGDEGLTVFLVDSTPDPFDECNEILVEEREHRNAEKKLTRLRDQEKALKNWEVWQDIKWR